MYVCVQTIISVPFSHSEFDPVGRFLMPCLKSKSHPSKGEEWVGLHLVQQNAALQYEYECLVLTWTLQSSVSVHGIETANLEIEPQDTHRHHWQELVEMTTNVRTLSQRQSS